MVLDLGCGASPYRATFEERAARWITLDLEPAHRPGVVARAESLPFPDASFDVVLSSQVLQLMDDPQAAGREIERVLKPGGKLLLTVPLFWPQDDDAPEHRFGETGLVSLFPGLEATSVEEQGGMLSVPSTTVNLFVREFVLASERRLGLVARILRLPAAVVYLGSNLSGRLLEIVAARGPLSRFLGHLDRRMPMNLFVEARKPE